MSSVFNVLLIGGRGQIGAGLRTYLPRLDQRYRITSVDLPGSPDRATDPAAQKDFVDLDISADPAALAQLVAGRDLVVYLARKGGLAEMNKMSDLVFESILAQPEPPMVVGSSSVHAVDGLYNFSDQDSVYWTISERQFDQVDPWPELISAEAPAAAINDYGREKEHVENWVKHMADQGHGAISTRWGGINAANKVMIPERGYFSLWCHQEDAANLVHASFQTHLKGSLPSGAHYFVISDNTYNIFDIDTPRRQVGYNPVHNAETYYQE